MCWLRTHTREVPSGFQVRRPVRLKPAMSGRCGVIQGCLLSGLRNSGEAMRYRARSAERTSEPQANGLTALLGHLFIS